MDSRFKITAIAGDQATPALAKVAKGVTDLFKKANKELGASLDDTVAKSMESIAKSSSSAVSAVSNLVPSFQSLAAIGSLSGLTYFLSRYTAGATAIAQTSQAVALGTDDLQLFEGAARRAGVSSDTMRSSMVSLSQAMRNARVGLNDAAASAQMTFGIDRNDPAKALLRIAEVYRSTFEANGPRAAISFGENFGLSPDLFPLLSKGRDGIKALMDETARSGVVMGQGATNDAQDFTHALANAGDAASGLGNKLAADLVPSLTKSLNLFSKFAVAYQEGGDFGAAIMRDNFKRNHPNAGPISPWRNGISLLSDMWDQASLAWTLSGTNIFGGSGRSGPPASTALSSPDASRRSSENDTMRALGNNRGAFLRDNFTPPEGNVRVDIRVHGVPNSSTVVQQSGAVDAHVETSMP